MDVPKYLDDGLGLIKTFSDCKPHGNAFNLEAPSVWYLSCHSQRIWCVLNFASEQNQTCYLNRCLIFQNIKSPNSLIRRIATRLLYRFNSNSRFRCFTTLTCWLSDLLSQNSVREPAGRGQSLQSSEPSTEQAGEAATVSHGGLFGMYILLTSFFQLVWS